jgi:hypothetical protein
MNVWRIGYDVDGVGFTFSQSVRDYLDFKDLGHLWKSGPNPKPYWDWYKDWGWTSKQFVDFCNEAADAGYLFSGGIREGYAESIQAVAAMGHHIVIATDRSFGSTPEVSQKLTVEWFEQHGIEYDELHFTANKPDAECDFFIEDKLENYDALGAAGTKTFLLNRPWNEVEGGDARNRIDEIAEYTEAISAATKRGHYDLSFA